MVATRILWSTMRPTCEQSRNDVATRSARERHEELRLEFPCFRIAVKRRVTVNFPRIHVGTRTSALAGICRPNTLVFSRRLQDGRGVRVSLRDGQGVRNAFIVAASFVPNLVPRPTFRMSKVD